MVMGIQRLTKSAAVGLAVAALSAPASAAQSDMRSPDARESDAIAPAAQDLRSPDSRSVITAAPARVDLRTADSRDAGEGRGTFNAPEVVFVTGDGPAPVSGGLDWGDAGVGAAGLLGMLAIGLGGAVAVGSRRRGRATIA